MVPKNACVERTLKRGHLIYSSDPTRLYFHLKDNLCVSGEGNFNLIKLGKIITILKSKLLYYLPNLN